MSEELEATDHIYISENMLYSPGLPTYEIVSATIKMGLLMSVNTLENPPWMLFGDNLNLADPSPVCLNGCLLVDSSFCKVASTVSSQ